MKKLPKYNFNLNDPFDKQSEIKYIIDSQMGSNQFMDSIKRFAVSENELAIWFLGQNGFILKSGSRPILAIDPYLTNSCATLYNDQNEFRLDRQLPVFIEPEDLDVDYILVTHSHDDHADPETLKRCGNKHTTTFIGPWEGYQKFLKCDILEKDCCLTHPNQAIEINGINIRGTFALPTDHTDLNHIGYMIEFSNGIRFYNSGDTAYCDLFTHINKFKVDICTICINGGFHNLSHMEAARIVKEINPKVVIPCHYDMMVNNVGDPDMFKAALQILSVKSQYQQIDYYQPWLYSK
jgi:L-ascorbate 6-phosphate lactonase